MTRTSFAFSLALLLVPVAAQATIVRAVQFEQKVENAASIVVGKCVAQESHWDDAKQWILTYSTFQIENTLKGQPAQMITLVTPGGTVDNIAQEVIGVPKFRQGDESVVFVRNTQHGPTVLYLEQGNYLITKNDHGDRMVTPSVTSAVLVDTGHGTAVTPEAPRTLRDFEGAVRDTVRRHETMRMEILKAKQKEQASFWNQIQRNKLLVAIALMGVLLASWQLLKRF